MTDRVIRSIDALTEEADTHSDKGLYPFLNVHIYGPYEDDCFAYLSDLKFKLQRAGFENTKICDDRGNEPPEHFNEQEEREFWWSESEEFLNEGDVSIFVFLDYVLERGQLSERAKQMVQDESEGGPTGRTLTAFSLLENLWHMIVTKLLIGTHVQIVKGLNSSVIAELFYWLENIDEDNNRTLVLFENGIYSDIGSLITGYTGVNDVDYAIIDNENNEEAYEYARAKCTNWAMNEMRETLKHRRFS